MTTTTTTTNHRTQVLLRHLSSSGGGGDSDNNQWKDKYSAALEEFVQQFPKIELHVHLDGSFDPDVLWQYIQANQPESLESLPAQTRLPWEADDSPHKHLAVQQLVRECRSSRDYHQLCTCRGHASLTAMLTCFEIFLPTVRRRLDLLEELAFDFGQRQWQQNVVYTEVRYSPFLLAEGYDKQQRQEEEEKEERITGADVYRCITTGLRRACQEYGIVMNQILCCITWRPDWAQPTLDLLLQHRHDFPCAAVGLDISAGEEHFDPTHFTHEAHWNVLQQAQAHHVPITLHAGEVGDNVRRAVHDYGATRIGHGYRIATQPELMAEMKQRHIHFEICPTSSVETGGWNYKTEGADEKKDWTQHPCRIMQAHGLSVSLHSDDPAVFHTSLAWQYRTALVKMNMTRADLYHCNLNAVQATFGTTDAQKRAWQQQIVDFCQAAGVLDAEGNVLDAETTAAPSGADSTQQKLPVYRRSVSENFKDRVYLQTTAAVATAAETTTTGDSDEEIQFYT